MLFANNANTTLASSLTNSATSMSVTSASAFPSPTGSQYFYCTLADAATQQTIEIVKVTAVSGTTFTIVRGQDGTSGTAFNSGDVVSLRLVRASLNDFPKLDENNTFTYAPTFNTALAVGSGGTGLTSTPSNGQIDIGNGTGFTRTTLTAGSNITITNGSGSISIASSASGGLSWQSVQTANFTASSGNAYPINTTSGAITVTLPASPSAGNIVTIVDYSGTAATNNIIVAPNGSKIQSLTNNFVISVNRQAYNFVYIDSTQGWISYAQQYLTNYQASYLVVAGGGGGGSENNSNRSNAGGGGAGGLLSGTTSLNPSTIYTVTVGAGGAGATPSGFFGTQGSNSQFASLTAAVGGGYGTGDSPGTAGSGGSGGGVNPPTGTAGSGTSGQGNNGAVGSTGSGGASSGVGYNSGGGGGAGAAATTATTSIGSAGGVGLTSTLITTTQATTYSVGQVSGGSVYFAGGGGGGSDNYRVPLAGNASGGLGGGGAGGNGGAGTAGSANTGGGGGGASSTASNFNGGNGGSGVVIISVPTSNYSGTTTGSPTVVTNGSNTVMIFKTSGSYTA